MATSSSTKIHRLRRVTSRQNALVKTLRRAFSQGDAAEDGLIAIEGSKNIEEAIRRGLAIRAVVFSDSGSQRAERLLQQLGSKIELLLVDDEIFRSAVETNSPQGVAALVAAPSFTFEDCIRGSEPLIVVTAGIQDPGNLGTIFRSAEAFGVSGVLLGEQTVSRFNPKVVRASAGSIFRLPCVAEKLAEAMSQLRGRRVRMVGTSSHKGKALDKIDFTGSVAVMIGNEGAGLPRELLAQLDDVITIPHSKKVESLNAGVAASVILYEAARQRKFA
jgi:TrmH family RNA methyltransferase